MQFRVFGLPLRFDLNGWMIAGFVFGFLGVAGGVAGLCGAWPQKSLPGTVSLGLALLGMALYFVGRLVDIVANLRKKP